MPNQPLGGADSFGGSEALATKDIERSRPHHNTATKVADTLL
ncbi:hypothetical protein [Mycobacterium montefiorense]|nr:hypothetical protein [Mycobacterium montefiorense]